MKNYIMIVMLLCSISGLFAQTTYNVYHGDSIQDVIDIASNEDRIHVHSYYTGYEGFDFDGKSLEIYSEGSPMTIINGDLSSPSLDIVIDMTYIDNPGVAPPELHGFKIIGSSSAEGVKLTNFDGLAPAKIYDNVIDGLGTAIYVGDNQKRIEITTNELLNNDIAYYSKETEQNSGFQDEFKYNTVYDNDTGLYLGYRSDTGVLGCLFYDNGVSIDLTDDTGQYSQALDLYECTITNTDLNNNDTGIFVSEYSTLSVISSIIYGNDTQIDNDNGTVTVTYSDIEDGYTGTGNIDDDPDFCMETNYEFNLLEGSPCIDTGDPTQTDLDGTRVDMGCYPTLIDIKYCEGNHWNWVSFPRLDRDDDEEVDAPGILDDFLDWPFNLELLYLDDNNPVLEYSVFTQAWNPASYDVKSSLGYKLDPQDNGDHYLPSQNGATCLPADWELTYTLLRETKNWMGYWLPWTQNIEDAFGEFWESVVSVEAEDWYYEYSEEETPTSSPTDKNMVYGKAYIVVFDEHVEEFYWTDYIEEAEQRERMESEYFSYNNLPSYEAIDVMDIPQNVIEIGVFEDDLCVGAVVVQDTCEQILVYSSSQVPFSFEVVTNNRQANQQIKSYQVLNKETRLYENRPLISGQQKSSVIMFGNLEDPQNETPVIDNVVLHGNYPNPFNPETKISFSLSQDQEIELTVYNLKGQKVRTLYTGNTSSGEQSVVWNGKGDDGKSVGSGLYFYKLRTENKELTKKMLLLK